ncbi:uncharacterized protein V6R79_023232 [Siganus canaliculatus]
MPPFQSAVEYLEGYSEQCLNRTTSWNRKTFRCEPCPLRPGYEVNPNCGMDDSGGHHDSPHTECKPGTFNTGKWAYCQKCSSCGQGYDVVSPCNTTSDTLCQRTTDDPVTTNKGSSPTPRATISSPHTFPDSSVKLWAIPLILLITIALIVLCIFFMKRKRGQNAMQTFNRRSSYINVGFSSHPAAPGHSDLETFLSPTILSAPLQTVLNNLDILEELVILLDPENQGVKGTKHLASLCSFPSTWITYTYSMKDSKSPLKAVLEGVTSRHPEWTVGNLTKLLKTMKRNDAIAVLAKLRVNEMEM